METNNHKNKREGKKDNPNNNKEVENNSQKDLSKLNKMAGPKNPMAKGRMENQKMVHNNEVEESIVIVTILLKLVVMEMNFVPLKLARASQWATSE